MKFDGLIKKIHKLNEKDYEKLSSYIREETLVDNYGNYQIYIYSESRPKPSFHIYNKTKQIHAVYGIKYFDYMEKHSNKVLSNWEIKELKEFLKSKNENGVLIIKEVIDAWNRQNKYKIKLEEINWL